MSQLTGITSWGLTRLLILTWTILQFITRRQVQKTLNQKMPRILSQKMLIRILINKTRARPRVIDLEELRTVNS